MRFALYVVNTHQAVRTLPVCPGFDSPVVSYLLVYIDKMVLANHLVTHFFT